MEIWDGKQIYEKEFARLKNDFTSIDKTLKIVILLNKDDKSSEFYAKAIVREADKLNVKCDVLPLEQDEKIYLDKIKELNADSSVYGVLITRPLSKKLDENKILRALKPSKDLDGIHPYNLGNLLSGDEMMIPNTALAMIKLVEGHNLSLKGKKVLIIGRSISVGKPVALLVLNRDATVTVMHSKSENLNEELKNYDVIFVAIGKPHFIDSKYMKEGAIVIDGGIHYLEDKIVGDVKPDEKLKAISKVPGGVGKLTTLYLFENLLRGVKYGQQ